MNEIQTTIETIRANGEGIIADALSALLSRIERLERENAELRADPRLRSFEDGLTPLPFPAF